MAATLIRIFSSPSPAGIRLVLRWMGVLFLLGGLATAVSIWIPQDRLERQLRALKPKELHAVNVLDPLSPDDSRRYAREVELYYGKSGLLMDKANRWFEELGQGKPLAWTVAVISVVIAGGMFLAAAIYRPERRLTLLGGGDGSSPRAE